MKILAFETSCDDTSVAIFEDDQLLAMDTMSQIKLHTQTGGVVPEIAAREHANNIFEVLARVLEKTSLKLEDIDYIGVTTHPGLLPSLITGMTVASTISVVLNKVIIPINHIEAHIFSNFLERKESEIPFPLVCLTVSGGHNDLYHMENMWDFNKIGTSEDDASGEAFDKVAKMMGLGYPGGPIIAGLAKEYEEGLSDKKNTLFPRVWLKKTAYDFSFSGLKSAVKREVDARILQKGSLSHDDTMEVAYEFENAVIEVLAYKTLNAAKNVGVKTIMLAGGVSANDKLRSALIQGAQREGITFISPMKKLYCMDNAAMVGINTYYRVKYNKFEHRIGQVS